MNPKTVGINVSKTTKTKPRRTRIASKTGNARRRKGARTHEAREARRLCKAWGCIRHAGRLSHEGT